MVGVLMILGLFMFLGFIVIAAAMEDGWSPIASWQDFQETRIEIKRKKRLAALEFQVKEAELKARQQAIQEKMWRDSL